MVGVSRDLRLQSLRTYVTCLASACALLLLLLLLMVMMIDTCAIQRLHIHITLAPPLLFHSVRLWLHDVGAGQWPYDLGTVS